MGTRVFTGNFPCFVCLSTNGCMGICKVCRGGFWREKKLIIGGKSV